MSVEVRAVRTNIDALSEARLHAALVATVESTLTEAEAFLRADRAGHSREGLLEEHIDVQRVEALANQIRGRIGITPVIEADERSTHGRYEHSSYPQFVEDGTETPIFPATQPAMWNMKDGIFGRKSVRGQEGQHFMARTYAEARVLLREDHHIADALRDMDAEAAVMKAAIEAT